VGTNLATESAVPGTARAARLPAGKVRGEARARLLRLMMLARATEQRARALGEGEDDASPAAGWRREAIGAGAVTALRPQDRLIAPGRYLAAHLGCEEQASVGSASPAPDLVPVAVGVALAVAGSDSDDVVLTLLDQGAMASDRWAESLSMATTERLPLVLVVERDRVTTRGVSAAPDATFGQALLGEAVDADDPEAVLIAVRAAVDRARGGWGPALVECVTGRVAAMAGSRRRVREGRKPASPDPIERYARRLLGRGMPLAGIVKVLRSAEEEVPAWEL
jgi:TPP-dependent pyruvate/acetoin dehydrogenase alpha subunit